MLTPAQAHFQHVMALRAGTAAENEDSRRDVYGLSGP